MRPARQPRYRRSAPAPLPARPVLPPPPVERPRMAWRREDGRGDIPADLWALMQEGGRRLAEAPSPRRAAQLLALTEHAAFKTWQPGTPAPWADEPTLEAQQKTAHGVSEDDWWLTAAEPETPRGALAEAYAAHAADVPAALANLRDDPANEGEAPFNDKTEAPRSAPAGGREWWE